MGDGSAFDRPWYTAFFRALERAARTEGVPGPRVVLFSGGLDSSLLAWELRREPGLRLFTVGLDGAKDFAPAQDTAQRFSLPWVQGTLSSSLLRDLSNLLATELHPLGATGRSVQLAFAAAMQLAPPGPLLCGQGADELFLGYAHYRGLDRDELCSRSTTDLTHLIEFAWPQTERIAATLGRSVRAPFLDPDVVRVARAVPIAELVADGTPKAALRAYARSRGLPDEAADRPKRALQYGTGVDRWLRRERREGSV